MSYGNDAADFVFMRCQPELGALWRGGRPPQRPSRGVRSASTYITAVGGTDDEDGRGDETAPDGGGGFSDTFAIPAYQQAAVAAYEQRERDASPPQACCNDDVSALAGEQNPTASASAA